MPGVLYYNGDILTMEPQLYAPAILVESGRIIWIRNKENEEYKKTWKSGKMMNLN